MKHCSFCAEEIQDAAIVCRHCGRSLTSPPPHQRPARWKGLLLVALLLIGLAVLASFLPASRDFVAEVKKTPTRLTVYNRGTRGWTQARLIVNALYECRVDGPVGPGLFESVELVECTTSSGVRLIPGIIVVRRVELRARVGGNTVETSRSFEF